MKSLRLPALAAALVLAACSSPAPTDPALRVPAAPSFDGGNTIGSGNGTGGSTGESTVSSDSTGRGPGMMGSGN
ncbi:MAG TPA: hypothetical protein VHG08_13040 [Longimicrobium sp.]|nr:hypothetical protein [Longimicrobium sp.]